MVIGNQAVGIYGHCISLAFFSVGTSSEKKAAAGRRRFYFAKVHIILKVDGLARFGSLYSNILLLHYRGDKRAA